MESRQPLKLVTPITKQTIGTTTKIEYNKYMIDYTKATEGMKRAWFDYKEAKSGSKPSLVSFAAGYNAAAKAKPVCPYCNEEMEPINYKGYYDSFASWECACGDRFPEEAKAPKCSGQYA